MTIIGDINAKPELDPDISIPLPTLALCPRESGWCQFWPEPRLLPGESTMKVTSLQQQLASAGVAKAIPMLAVSRMNKGNTQEWSLQEETRLEFFASCQKSCCVDTQALSRSQTAMRKHSGKANRPSDNEEIQDYCLASRQNEDRSITSVKEISGICISKTWFLVICDFHIISKYDELPPIFALELLIPLTY